MLLGIISDIHADTDTLRMALAQITGMKCDRVVCCGDIVDLAYRITKPDETVRLLVETGVECISGNHDRWLLEILGGLQSDQVPDIEELGDPPELHALDDETVVFLSRLPAELDLDLDGVKIAVRHGSPMSDMDLIDPDMVEANDLAGTLAIAKADILVVGHYHAPYQLHGPEGMILNPGPVQRESASSGRYPGGTFGVLELPAKAFTVYRAEDGVEVRIRRKELPTEPCLVKARHAR